MEPFNVEDYLDRRSIADMNNKVGTATGLSKYEELQAASAEKLANLAEITKSRKADRESWANKLMGDNATGFIGSVANMGATFVENAAREAGQMMSAPALGQVSALEATLTPEDYQARNNAARGEASAWDKALLSGKRSSKGIAPVEVGNSPVSRLAAVTGLLAKAVTPQENLTTQEKFDRMDNLRQLGMDIKERTDLKDIVHKARRETLTNDIKDTFEQNKGQVSDGWDGMMRGDVLSGVGNMFSGSAKMLGGAAYDVASNPVATLEGIVGQAPQIGMSLMGKGAGVALNTSLVGYGLQNYHEGIANYQATHNGEYPPENVRDKMKAYAATLPAAEKLGLLGQIKGVTPKAVIGDVGDAAARLGFKESLKRTGKVVASGIGEEGATETYQTFAEGEATLKPATGADIFAGGVQGAATGGGTSGGLHIASEATGGTEQHQAVRQAVAAQQVLYGEASKTGDVSAFTNPEVKSYSPERAVGALFGHSKLATTSPETKQGNLEQANQIVSDLTARLDSRNSSYEEKSTQTPEDTKQYKELLVSKQEALAALDPADTVKAAELKDHINVLTDTIDSANPKAYKAGIDKMAKQLSQATTIKDQLSKLVDANPSNMAAQVEVLSKPVDVADPVAVGQSRQAAGSIVRMSMASPESLTVAVADQLVSNPDNGLTKPERDYLTAFSEARTKESELVTRASVRKDIYHGGNGNVGISQYRSMVMSALASGNMGVATTHLKALSAFAADHQEKAARSQEAMDLSASTGKKVQILKEANGWQVSDKVLPEPERKAKNGLNFSANYTKLLDDVMVESNALNGAAKELKAAYAVKAGSQPTVAATSPVKVTAKSLLAASKGVVAPVVSTNVDKANTSQKPVQKTEKSTQVVETGVPTVESTKTSQTAWEALKAKTQASAVTEQSTAELVVANKPKTALTEQAAEHLKYLRNPPETYTTAKAAAIGRWAQGQEVRLKAEIQKIDEDFDEINRLEDLMGDMRLLVKTSAEMVNADATLESKLGPQGKDSVVEPAAQVEEAPAVVAPEDRAEVVAETPTKEVDPLNAGGLSVFTKAVTIPLGKLNEMFRSLNLVGQFLKQDKANARNLTNRPLVAKKDFLTAWSKGETFHTEFLKDGDDLNESQTGAINNLYANLQAWVPLLRDNLKTYVYKDDAFKERDMLQYLMDGNQDKDGKPNTEENVQTAMAYSAYHWIVSKANAPAFLLNKQINDMHSRDKGSKISPEGVKALQGVTSFESTTIAELGEIAAQALGLRETTDAPQDLLPKLKAAMGIHILALLEQQGFIARKSIDVSVVDGFFATPDTQSNPLSRDTLVPLDSTESVQDEEGNPVLPRAADTNYAREAMHSYVTMVRASDGRTLSDAAKTIKDANSKSKSVVDRLFGIDKAPRIAGTTPQKFVQQYAKGTQQLIPELQRKVIQDVMNTPHRPIPDMFALASALGRAAILTVNGWRDIESGNIHADNLRSVEAQNMNVENQFDVMQEMLDENKDGLDQDYFVEGSVWKNFRAGWVNSSLNQQASKIHRYMFSRPAWTSTIKLGDQQHMTEFKVAFAMAMGLKTDQQPNVKTLDLFDQMLLDKPKILKAVEVIRQGVILGNDAIWTTENTEMVRDVATKAEGMVSLQALMAYARYIDAEAKGEASFTATMLVGADGKTNGPILTQLALGAAKSLGAFFELLGRGGIYSTAEGEPKHFSEYYEREDSQDLYEDLGTKAFTEMQGNVRTLAEIKALHAKKDRSAFNMITQGQLDAFEVVGGKLLNAANKISSVGRNFIKTPLTAFMFGSALMGAIKSMENSFMESYTKALEGFAEGTRKGTLKDFVRATNELLVQGDYKLNDLLNENATIEHLLKTPLRPAQDLALRKAFQKTMGNSVNVAMKRYFSVFLTRRDALNKTIQASHAVSAALFADARAQAIEKLMDSGELAYRDSTRTVKEQDSNTGRVTARKVTSRVPLTTLSVAQEKKIRLDNKDMLPVMHTDYSLNEDNLDAGLYMAKTSMQPYLDKTNEDLYKVKVELANGINRRGKQSSYLDSRGMARNESDAGVAGLSYAIHSSDSANMHKAMAKQKEMQANNVHDEIATSVTDVAGAAEAINAATVDTFLNYSPAREAMHMLERLVTGMATRLKEGTVADSAVGALFEQLSAVTNFRVHPDDNGFVPMLEVGKHTIEQAAATAFAADTMRLTAFTQMAVFDQYTWEGGQSLVTQEQRDQAAQELAVLSPKPSKELQGAMDYLSQRIAQMNKVNGVWLVENDFVGDLANARELGAPGILAHVVVAARASEIPEVAKLVAEGVSIMSAINRQKPAERADAIEVIAHTVKELPREKMTAYGELGTPVTESDPDLVKFFEQNNEAPVARVIEGLKRKFSQGEDTLTNRFNLKLLAMVAKVIDPDLIVQYVNKDTPPDMVMDKGASNARGWYSIKTDPSGGKGEHRVFVLSPEFLHSGLTPEMLLHELVHAALGRTMLGELVKKARNSKYTSEALTLVNGLESLRKAAGKYIEEHGLTQFKDALTDVHELVAWGMTNEAFQNDVLKKVEITSRTGKIGLLDGLQSLISGMLGLLFGRATTKSEANGLGVLVTNVAGLFAEAAKVPSYLGSIPTGNATMPQRSSTPAQRVMKYDSMDLFTALGDVSTERLQPEFREHLEKLLQGIVNHLHGRFGSLKRDLMKDQALSPLDKFNKAMATGEAPFASKIMASGFKVTSQVAYAIEQVEATTRAALFNSDVTTTSAYRALDKLYTEVRGKLQPENFFAGDWAKATPDEVSQAEALHGFIFEMRANSSTDVRADYLSRFVAMGLGHPVFNQILKAATERDTRSTANLGILARLGIWFDKVVEWMGSRIAHVSSGQDADAKMLALVETLVEIEAKKRHALIQKAQATNYIAPIENGIKGMMEATRKKVGEVGQSNFIQNSALPLVKAAGTVVSAIAEDRFGQLMDVMQMVRNKSFDERQGMLSHLLSDVKGHPGYAMRLLEAAKLLDRNRKHVMTEVSKVVLDSFIGKGKDLTRDAKQGVTALFLSTGAHSLLPHFSMDQLHGLLSDQSQLSTAVKSFEAKLVPFAQYADNVLRQSKSLAYYKATGKNKSEFLLMNAGNIAKMYGTSHEGQLTTAQTNELEKVVDVLVSLYAIQYSPSMKRSEATKVLAAENGRNDKGNGVKMLLMSHAQFEKESRERLFYGSEALMMKGFTPEIMNPYTDMVVQYVDQADPLLDLGYVMGARVDHDPTDPDGREKRIFVLKDGGLANRVTGIIAATDMKSKGTDVHSGNLDTQSYIGLKNSQLQDGITQQKRDSLANDNRDGVSFDPAKVTGNFMAPTLNADGVPVNYRYLMHESTKESVLEKDSQFDNVMGMMAGNAYDKETGPEQNKKAIQAMFDQYNQDYAAHPEAYRKVGPTSQDPEMREIYRLLPKETKAEVERIWGSKDMLVRVELLDINFGYRKLSLSTAFNKVNQNVIEKLFVGMVEGILYSYARYKLGMDTDKADKYSRRGAVVVRRAERVWEELVRETKDIFVIKSGSSMLNNIISNVSALALNGVPMVDIIRNHIVATKGAISFQKDTNDLFALKKKLAAGYTLGNEAEMKREVIRLENALQVNPVRELMEAGMMPTIVEGIEGDDDQYSYKTLLTRKTERFVKKINPMVVGAAKQIYMAKGSFLHNKLSEITQLSDFVAKYTLYQHLTTRAEAPLSKEAAVRQASDTFINYDVPMHRSMQYLDDMGIMPFMKYYIRIQRVILQIARDNPGRVMGEMVLNSFLGGLPMVMDASALARIGRNPASMGAFTLLTAGDDLLTVKAALSLIK